MESGGGLANASTGELVEAAESALLELLSREVPGSGTAALELAERVGRVLDLGQALLAVLTARVDAVGAHRQLGRQSASAWLRTRLGMRKGRASEIVTVGRQLIRLEETAGRLLSGRLPWGQAATIAQSLERLPSGEDVETGERILLDLVDAGAVPDETAKMGRVIKDRVDERLERAPDDVKRGYERSWIRMSASPDGGAHLYGWLRPEDAAAVAGTMAPLLRSRTKEDDRDHAQRTADALVSCATRGHRNAGITLVVDLAAYQAKTGSSYPFDQRPSAASRPPSDATSHPVTVLGRGAVRGRSAARLLDGTELSVEDARRVAVFAGISTLVVGRSGVPLYLGRSERLASEGQRRALEALYETCCVKGCTVPAHLAEIHHLGRGWSRGTPTDIDHLAPACRWHNVWIAANPTRYHEYRDDRGKAVIEVRAPWETAPASRHPEAA
ncbi:DUF222 domain-containing protein [Actinocorallia sp. B10E7]|uniref:DUF222 domain-containing protein n=1 Tax=Actinocorallia sp. B10E7 TaxID=3153558 RepID=UPI00325D52B5